jgi:hypothetical protein
VRRNTESIRLRWPIASACSGLIAGTIIGVLAGYIDKGAPAGRATVIPFGIAAGLVAIGAMLPGLLFRPPNLKTAEASLYVGPAAGTIGTVAAYFTVLSDRYHSTLWTLYWSKPLFHTLAVLVFWLAVTFGDTACKACPDAGASALTAAD